MFLFSRLKNVLEEGKHNENRRSCSARSEGDDDFLRIPFSTRRFRDRRSFFCYFTPCCAPTLPRSRTTARNAVTPPRTVVICTAKNVRATRLLPVGRKSVDVFLFISPDTPPPHPLATTRRRVPGYAHTPTSVHK